ncbi:epimerase [Rhodobacteraceae bacterium WD3A24]|nr:epimerase [Rhodobacteraceae bacterium WD3A24]
MTREKGTALILGGSGRFGRATAEAFAKAGWHLRRFDRARDSLPEAAMGADIIVNGWNPPYHRWAAELPGLTAQVIEAARASGARVIIPGNVYVFGAGSGPVLSESAPHAAANPLGRLRTRMEAAFRAAGVPTLVVRAGDFLDTRASGNWFDMVLTKRLDRGRLTYPGPLDVPHAWAYLPDMARAAVELAERRETLRTFEDVPFPGYTLTGRELAAALARASGRPVRARRMAWWPLRLARPVWPLASGLLEMRYLWAMPHRLDGDRLARLLPEFRNTPLDVALASAIGQADIHPDEPVARGADAALAQ